MEPTPSNLLDEVRDTLRLHHDSIRGKRHPNEMGYPKSKPSSHLAGGADGMIAVEDRFEVLGVLLADGTQHVLNDAAHGERDDEPAA